MGALVVKSFEIAICERSRIPYGNGIARREQFGEPVLGRRSVVPPEQIKREGEIKRRRVDSFREEARSNAIGVVLALAGERVAGERGDVSA